MPWAITYKYSGGFSTWMVVSYAKPSIWLCEADRDIHLVYALHISRDEAEFLINQKELGEYHYVPREDLCGTCGNPHSKIIKGKED